MDTPNVTMLEDTFASPIIEQDTSPTAGANDEQNGVEQGREVRKKQRTWMEKPIISETDTLEGLSEGLEFLVPLNRLYIYERIAMVDVIFDKAGTSKNMLTVRNDSFQQVYYIVTSHNKSTGRYRGFKYRIIDQYGRHIFTVCKYFKMPICGVLEADVRCPPGHTVANIRQIKQDSISVGYKITRPNGKVNFEILRKESFEECSTFDIMYGSQVVGRIAKRAERERGTRGEQSIYDKDFIRIDFPAGMRIFEKLIVLSTALLINVAHFRGLKTY